MRLRDGWILSQVYDGLLFIHSIITYLLQLENSLILLVLELFSHLTSSTLD